MRTLAFSFVLITGCASAPTLPEIGNALQQTQDAYYRVADSHDRICKPVPVLPQLAGRCIELQAALDTFAVNYNLLVDFYSAANDGASE